MINLSLRQARDGIKNECVIVNLVQEASNTGRDGKRTCKVMEVFGGIKVLEMAGMLVIGIMIGFYIGAVCAEE